MWQKVAGKEVAGGAVLVRFGRGAGEASRVMPVFTTACRIARLHCAAPAMMCMRMCCC